MKILAVSLLRLGDLVMHHHLVRDVRRTYPGCEVHLLINEQFKGAQDLLPLVDRFHLFPRQNIQRELVESSGSFFRAYQRVSSLVRDLNVEKFDLVLDLTHNLVSHKLVDLIEARDKRASVTGYFNDIFSLSSHPSFHYLDALRSSLGLASVARPQTVESRKSKIVSIQPLTSDAKKNWGLRRFSRFVDILKGALPDYQFVILGAPFEEELLRKSFIEDARTRLQILSLKELEVHLWESELLISGDTATLHLAAQCRTPQLGIYVGSADPFKTAPYVAGAIIVHSLEACSPCRHSINCDQISQLCADGISAENLAQIALTQMQNGADGLRENSQHWEWAVYQTRIGVGGEIVLEDLASLEETIRHQIHQLAWRGAWSPTELIPAGDLLSRHADELLEIAVHVKEEMAQQNILGDLLKEIEHWTQTLSKELLLNSDQPEQDRTFLLKIMIREWQRMSSERETTALLESLLEESEKNNAFTFYKRARFAVNLIGMFWSSKNRIYENLRNQLRERGFNYVSGPGKLS